MVFFLKSFCWLNVKWQMSFCLTGVAGYVMLQWIWHRELLSISELEALTTGQLLIWLSLHVNRGFFSWKSYVIMASNFLHFPCWSFFLASFRNLWPCSEKDTKERTDTRRSQSTGPHQHLWDAGLTSQRWWQEEPFNWSTQADNPSVWHWPASLLCCSQCPVHC